MISNRKRPNHVYISKTHPFYRMTYNGYVSEARLNMAEHLGRCLGGDEYIYFKDGNSFNEGVDNLELVSHKEFTKMNQIRRVSNQIEQLTEIKRVMELQLSEITFNHTPCNCNTCTRSLESRQASYKL